MATITSLLVSFTFLTATITRVISRISLYCRGKLGTWFNDFTFRALFVSIASKVLTMRLNMLRLILSKYKVIKHIVAGIAVSMVDNFRLLKMTTKVLFHNVAVRKHSFSVYLNNMITVWSDMTTFIARVIRTTKTKSRTSTSAVSLLTPIRLKDFVATYTLMYHKDSLTNKASIIN